MDTQTIKGRRPGRERNPLPGQVSLFRGKVRRPVSITLTPTHHEKVTKATKRLGITRSDLLGLLIDQFADTVRI
jgi:hypothetical protein